MDRMDNQNETHAIQEPEPPTFKKKIGATTYEVFIYFSETSTESLSDKIKRLIQNDSSNLL